MTGAVGAADQNIGAEACPNACFSAGTDIVAGEEARAGDRVGDHRPHHPAAAEFDFEWVNRSFFFDLDRPTAGYFGSSELSSHGRPADARERVLLASFLDAVRLGMLEGTWSPPVSDGFGRDRTTLKALAQMPQQFVL
jgi:hypothetical protein